MTPFDPSQLAPAEEEQADDLAPARGMFNGLLIAVPMWLLIAIAWANA